MRATVVHHGVDAAFAADDDVTGMFVVSLSVYDDVDRSASILYQPRIGVVFRSSSSRPAGLLPQQSNLKTFWARTFWAQLTQQALTLLGLRNSVQVCVARARVALALVCTACCAHPFLCMLFVHFHVAFSSNVRAV